MEFTHFDDQGNALMVDVGDKAETKREAVARGSIFMSPECLEKVARGTMAKGDVLGDPDDKTPLAIRNTGADIVSYGAPVLPGAMFLLAYYQVKDGENPRTVAIMGLPGCVMYARRTIFDLVLPRIMADDQVTADDLAALGQGGLCLNCPECTFPNCGFGKGM